MMRNRRHYRKPRLLLLLVAAMTLGAVMTPAVNAGELIDYRPADPGTRLMSLFLDDGYVHDPGNPDSRLQVSFTPPPLSSAAAGRSSVKPSSILFSWRVRW
jgi:hypothetical protein